MSVAQMLDKKIYVEKSKWKMMVWKSVLSVGYHVSLIGTTISCVLTGLQTS